MSTKRPIQQANRLAPIGKRHLPLTPRWQGTSIYQNATISVTKLETLSNKKGPQLRALFYIHRFGSDHSFNSMTPDHYPFPLMVGTDGLGVTGADGLGATGVDGVLGRGLIGAEGLGATGALGFEKAGAVGLDSAGAKGSLAPLSGPEVVWFGSVPPLPGFSVVPAGLVSIV